MKITAKIFNGKLIDIFDTEKDKKKEIIFTPIKDFQKEAEIKFFVNGKKIKTISYKNLPPTKGRMINLPIVLELIDNKFFNISCKGREKKVIKHEIDLENIKEPMSLKKIIGVSSILLLLALIVFLFSHFNLHAKLADAFTTANLTLSDFKEINNLEEEAEPPTQEDEKISNEINTDTEISEENAPENGNSILPNDDIETEEPKNKDIKNITIPPKEEKNDSLDNNSKNDFTKKSLQDVINKNSPFYFIMDQAELLDGEINKLNTIIDYLKNYKKVKLILKGHARGIGRPENEMKLSIKRAKYIEEEIKNNLPNTKTEFEINGYGATMMIVSEENQEKKYINRRVEILVINAE